MMKQINRTKQSTKDERDIVDQGTLRITDLIAPDAMKLSPYQMQLGDRYVRTVYVTGYPRFAQMGWLNRLYSYPENIDISIHIEPLPTEKVVKTLTKKITQYTSTLKMDMDKGNTSDVAIESALSDANNMRDNLYSGNEKFFFQSISITVAGKSLEELDTVTEKIETVCSGAGMLTRTTDFQHDRGFITTLPLGQDRIGFKRNFHTSSLATCLPIVSSELTRMEGNPILYGRNLIDGSLLMFDRFKMDNFNSLTVAAPGSGKSYFVKLESMRYRAMGTNILIVDPQGEYSKQAEAYGGEVVKLSSTSKHRINPLDIEKTEDEEQNFLTSKILSVVSIVEVMIDRNLSARERKILMDATEETYGDFGITRNIESLEDESIFDDDTEVFQLEAGTKKMPTLSDLEGKLRSRGEEAVNLADEVEPHFSGVLSLFNGETNVDTNSKFVVFDIKDMESEITNIAMFATLEFIWNKIQKDDGQKRLLIVDEAWQLMRNETCKSYIKKVAKTARKFNAGISIITQQVGDLKDAVGGNDSILGNIEMKVLLKAYPNEVKELTALMELSAREENFLKGAGKGEALVFAGRDRTAVKVEANQFEHLICDTTRENRERFNELLRSFQ